MPKRKHIPTEIQTQVLVNSARRCCLCFGLDNDFSEKQGQIAHLDQNPSNSDPENLVYLCLAHHDQFDSRTSQSKGLTASEVKHYRELLYQTVCEARKPKSGQDEAVIQKSDPLNFLPRIRTGKELVEVAADAHFYAVRSDETTNEQETELIARFLEDVVEICEDLGSLGSGAAIRAAFWLNPRIAEVEQIGFKVFGKRERKKAKVGDARGPSDTAVLNVIRATDPMIIDLDAVRVLFEQIQAGYSQLGTTHAELLPNMFRKLVETEHALLSFIVARPFDQDQPGDTEVLETLRAASENMGAFSKLLRENRIYFSAEMCEHLDELDLKLHKTWNRAYTLLDKASRGTLRLETRSEMEDGEEIIYMSPDLVEFMELSMDASDITSKRKRIEDEFRRILGVEDI